MVISGGGFFLFFFAAILQLVSAPPPTTRFILSLQTPGELQLHFIVRRLTPRMLAVEFATFMS